MARKLKRIQYTVDILFDEFVDPSHIKVLGDKIIKALKHESDSGQGLGDDNAVPVEIRAYNPDAGVSSYIYEGTEGWKYNFVTK